MDDDLDPKRRLRIPGSYNIRDLGGYETRDGRRTRWGRLLRADSLHRLDAASQQALLALDDSLPALFHCSAGTDRTGMVAALVPGIAGVAPEVIARE